MRRGWPVPAMIVVAVLGTAGCTTAVPGSGTAAPPVPSITSPPSTVPAAPTATIGPRSGLDVDPVADECLLNASEFGALVGRPVRPPEQNRVVRTDGSTGSSCVATAGSDPLAMINVYAVRSGTPADYVRAGLPAARELPGVGESAAVFDTPTGPTMQLASPDYLVTILVTGAPPSDAAWSSAATAALSRLPS